MTWYESSTTSVLRETKQRGNITVLYKNQVQGNESYLHRSIVSSVMSNNFSGMSLKIGPIPSWRETLFESLTTTILQIRIVSVVLPILVGAWLNLGVSKLISTASVYGGIWSAWRTLRHSENQLPTYAPYNGKHVNSEKLVTTYATHSDNNRKYATYSDIIDFYISSTRNHYSSSIRSYKYPHKCRKSSPLYYI